MFLKNIQSVIVRKPLKEEIEEMKKKKNNFPFS